MDHRHNKETGVITWNHSICRIWGDHIPGLVYSFIGEVLRIHSLKDSPTYGMVVNLYRDTTMHVLVGALVLTPQR